MSPTLYLADMNAKIDFEVTLAFSSKVRLEAVKDSAVVLSTNITFDAIKVVLLMGATLLWKVQV